MRLFAWAAMLRWAAGSAVVALDAKASKMVQALDAALNEETARGIVRPLLDNLKELHPEVVEKIVMRQWWELAQEVVLKSHTQQVDFSFSVRKAVRALKDEADELLRTLNPKYGEAQQVSPAFQWAQNDTCIFLTMKYTVRWNAPGALEVTDPSVEMGWNWFNFTGLGKHSNNKYRYVLSLPLFDHISAQHSSWSAASVGKLSVTLRKRWPRKWPRLLTSKKVKMSNMHVWMEMQEKLDTSLNGMSSVSQSPITCGELDKLYCAASDSCKKADNCTQCQGKQIPKPEESLCTGLPVAETSLTFSDSDMHKGKLGGDVTIGKAKTEWDIDTYRVYLGKDSRTKWENDKGEPVLIGEVEPTRINGLDASVKIPHGMVFPPDVSHLLVFSTNEYGEFEIPGNVAIRDATLPKGKPDGISFTDEDGEKGEVNGMVTVLKATNEEDVTSYTIYWGKSPTKKATSSWITELTSTNFAGRPDVTYHIAKDTKPPDGAHYLLAFSKNEFGELPQPVSVKLIDNTKPCLTSKDGDCVVGVSATLDSDPDVGQVETMIRIEPALEPRDLTQYRVYWGKRSCSEDGKGAKNGHIRDVDARVELQLSLDSNTFVPPSTSHILVFSANKHGESDFCVSISFEDHYFPQPLGEKAEL